MSLMLMLAHAGESSGGFHLELPPLHPMLVNFTAALLPASLFSDVLGRLLRKQSLLTAGWWMLLYAAVITPFTALAGWWWFRDMQGMDMAGMSIHKWLGTAMAFVFPVIVIWRWRIHRVPDRMPSGRYLICAAIVVAALVVQAHIGGSMSFGSAESAEQEQEKPSHSWPATQEQDHGHGAMQDHTMQSSSPPASAPHDGQGEHQHDPWRDHIDVP